MVTKVLQFWLETRLASLWLPFLLLRKYDFRVCSVSFGFLIILFDIWYSFTLHWHIDRPITTTFSLWSKSSRMRELCCSTKYGFRVCVSLFLINSTHYKMYIHLPCIITYRRITESLVITHALSSSNRIRQRIYQLSTDRCEGYCNSDVICLFQPSLTIHYFNQSVLAIVPDLNIFVWSITIFHPFTRSALVHYFYFMG